MLKTIYAAVYTAIVLDYVRRIFTKVKVPLDFSPHVEYLKPDADECIIYANAVPVFWCGTVDEANIFFYNACARCRSLATKLTIVQTDDPTTLLPCEATGCTDEEVLALNQTIDDTE